jgi:Tfp pilus assembly protein PilW
MVQLETIDRMTDEQLGKYAMEVLSRELGLAGFARHLRVYHSGQGDDTRDRQQFIGHLTLDDIKKQMEQIQQ